jgi:putative hydrolase of the HAD superfamily
VAETSDIELVLVDFDDTLVDTAPRFYNARLELFRMLTETGYAESDIIRIHHDQIDPIMRQRFGFGPQRLEHSFSGTYEALCNAHGHALDEEIVTRARRLGQSVAGAPPLFDGAVNALERLTRFLPTALYTQSGDADYQMSCVQASGILEVIPVDRVVIVDHKTPEAFERVLANFAVTAPDSVWMIGNSMRHDINPALEIGANAIYIEMTNPWEFDVVPPVSESFHTVRSFAEAVNLILPVQES